MKNINVILFDNFTLLDAIGPIEVFRCLGEEYDIQFYSQRGGTIKTNPDLHILTKPIKDIRNDDVLLIPGGIGTREVIKDHSFIDQLHELAMKSQFVLTVCTGSALLARTGLLDNVNATSNKLAFDWVKEQGKNVKWVKKARWVVDGKYYTSSGVTAGIDMALGFVKDTVSQEKAKNISRILEYVWNEDKEVDIFS